jgi:REase associating with pPIWI_RE/pPIWI_RE three-gene island domain Y
MEEISPASFSLSSDELTIHLIASGLVRLAEQTMWGKPIAYPYPLALQKGLDRLVIACIRQGIPVVQSVPDLFDWCRRPIHSWGLNLRLDEIGTGDTFLNDQLPTQVCEDWACTSPHVEAELSEQRLMRSVLATCHAASAQDTYIEFRTLLITRPVLTLQELQQQRSSPKLALLADHLREAYIEAPLNCLFHDQFYCCAECNNLLLSTTAGTPVCENERCRQKKTNIANRTYHAGEGVLWLKRGLRRFVSAPGKTEMELYQTLLDESTLEVELWPTYDAYDLRVIFPDREVWAVDVKDWANPFLLAHRVDAIPPSPPWTRAYFVFPDDRQLQRSDYARAFTHHCPFLGKSQKSRTTACFVKDFLSAVRKKLKGIQNSSCVTPPNGSAEL